MGYTYTDPVGLMAYSVKQGMLLIVYKSGDLQAWDPSIHRVLYYIQTAHKTLLRNYPITCLHVKDEKNQFFTGASNGSIQIRLIRTGRLLDELFMRREEDEEADKGLVEVTLIEEINGQIIASGAHRHIVQFDLRACAYRSEWAHAICPLVSAHMHAPNLLVSLHANGDLIYWRLAYKKRWVALNVHEKGRRHRHLLGEMVGGEESGGGGKSGRGHGRSSEEMIGATDATVTHSKLIKSQQHSASRAGHGGSKARTDGETIEDKTRPDGTEIDATRVHGGGGASNVSTNERRGNERGGGSGEGGSKDTVRHEEERVKSGEKSEKDSAVWTDHDFRAFIFLKKNRAIFFNEKVGNLLLVQSGSDFIQCWNMFGFVSQFPVRKAGCWMGGVACAIVDPDERFLFLGSTLGYVRTYYIEGYQNPAHTSRLSRVQLRAIFPFLWKSLHKTVGDRIKNQDDEVPLVNNYRAHMNIIASLVYLPRHQALVSASHKVVRLWHVSGRFLGALGATVDARDIPQSMGLIDTLPPPYFLPVFLSRYEKGVGLGTRKVLLREWEESSSARDDVIPAATSSSRSDVIPSSGGVASSEAPPCLEDLLAKRRAYPKTVWQTESSEDSVVNVASLRSSTLNLLQLEQLTPPPHPHPRFPKLTRAEWRLAEKKIRALLPPTIQKLKLDQQLLLEEQQTRRPWTPLYRVEAAPPTASPFRIQPTRYDVGTSSHVKRIDESPQLESKSKQTTSWPVVTKSKQKSKASSHKNMPQLSHIEYVNPSYKNLPLFSHIKSKQNEPRPNLLHVSHSMGKSGVTHGDHQQSNRIPNKTTNQVVSKACYQPREANTKQKNSDTKSLPSLNLLGSNEDTNGIKSIQQETKMVRWADQEERSKQSERSLWAKKKSVFESAHLNTKKQHGDVPPSASSN